MKDDVDGVNSMIDSQMIGHSANFKTVTRKKLDRINGSRPKYEMDFSNSVYRYNVKYIDKKITGKVVFDSPEVKPRAAHPRTLCRRDLTRLAEIALDVRKASKKEIHLHGSSNGPSISKHRLRGNKS